MWGLSAVVFAAFVLFSLFFKVRSDNRWTIEESWFLSPVGAQVPLFGDNWPKITGVSLYSALGYSVLRLRGLE